jgi:hypothetical protein
MEKVLKTLLRQCINILLTRPRNPKIAKSDQLELVED